jgi:hypothetical protein
VAGESARRGGRDYQQRGDQQHTDDLHRDGNDQRDQQHVDELDEPAAHAFGPRQVAVDGHGDQRTPDRGQQRQRDHAAAPDCRDV